MKTSRKRTSSRFLLRPLPSKLIGLITLCALILCLSGGPVASREQSAPGSIAKAGAQLPVILLTGFEPFGKGKPPNPSWESIKDLNGQQWKGYQLVSKQLPVIWGAPLENLQVWIDQYKPVAIFSFGQGGKGSFAIETKASNQRGGSSDNKGEKAPQPKIAAEGAGLYNATINSEKFAQMLKDKGHQVRVSTSAGKYLCEECLYTLEHLKATRDLKGTVMFCHVPPLNTEAQGKKVTAEFVQNYVKDVLETWYILNQSGIAAIPSKPAEVQSKDPRTQDTKDIKEFIGRYFSTWSNQDMKGYDGCFNADACIQFVDPKGGVSTSSRVDFIASQSDYHKTSPTKTTEVAESMEIRFEAKLARVIVFWKLTAGPRTETGYDHFTLIKNSGRWQIVNLTFYASDKKIPD